MQAVPNASMPELATYHISNPTYVSTKGPHEHKSRSACLLQRHHAPSSVFYNATMRHHARELLFSLGNLEGNGLQGCLNLDSVGDHLPRLLASSHVISAAQYNERKYQRYDNAVSCSSHAPSRLQYDIYSAMRLWTHTNLSSHTYID